MFSAPLKCVPSVTRTSLFLHSLGALMYTCCVYYEHNHRPASPKFKQFGGRLQFLTMINFYLTCAASVFALCVDVIQMTTKSLQRDVEITKDGYPPNTSIFIRIRDELISCWMYAGCTIVPILYWGIVVADRNGIHNEETEKRLPIFGVWNQVLHTLPLPYALLLIIGVNYENIPLRRVLVNCALFITGYLSWLSVCASYNGHWVYPVLEKQTRNQFVVFVGVCILVLIFLQLCGRWMASLVWSEKRRQRVIAMEMKLKD